MGDDFPYVPVFRIYLVRQWIHAPVSQGCCGTAGFVGYDAPRAVFFDSGRCKAGFVSAVFPLVVRPKILASWCYGPEGHFHSVEVPQVQFLDKFDVPVVFRDRYAQSHFAKTVEIS